MKITFTALGIKFDATVKYDPGHPGSHDEPPSAPDIEILTLTHTEVAPKDAKKFHINRIYDCIFLLGATCGEEIIDAAMVAAQEEIKRLREDDAIDRAEYQNERFKDWSAA